ncbi:hypothetical protein ABT186_28580 [Streptomyces sp. NPDC001634]|uniref:hypothetical protein n=1 Tax=Streptomyces sp. NPDC001634 TaxID=3154390 RepID=UPI0033325B28
MDDELIDRDPCQIKGAGKEPVAEGRIATVAQVEALADATGIRWWLMVATARTGRCAPRNWRASAAGMSTLTTG